MTEAGGKHGTAPAVTTHRAEIGGNPRGIPGSVRLGRDPDADHGETLRARRRPDRDGNRTLHPRHSTSEVGEEPGAASLVKAPMAGSAWYRWEVSGRSARA
jgi:hypothetical protein